MKGEPFRREGRHQGGGEGSTLTHTRSTCTALLPAQPPDAPVGNVASSQAPHEASGELCAGDSRRGHPCELHGQWRTRPAASSGSPFPAYISPHRRPMEELRVASMAGNIQVSVHCCKRTIHMLKMFQKNVASISCICCKSRSRYCNITYVASV